MSFRDAQHNEHDRARQRAQRMTAALSEEMVTTVRFLKHTRTGTSESLIQALLAAILEDDERQHHVPSTNVLPSGSSHAAAYATPSSMERTPNKPTTTELSTKRLQPEDIIPLKRTKSTPENTTQHLKNRTQKGKAEREKKEETEEEKEEMEKMNRQAKRHKRHESPASVEIISDQD